jgi:prevent-host-death family protein
MADILEVPFVGTYELRKNLPLLLRRLQKMGEGVVVTQKGKPAGMLLSVKRYLEMKMLNEELEDALRELADKNYLAELAAARKEIITGKGKKARKVFSQLGI